MNDPVAGAVRAEVLAPPTSLKGGADRDFRSLFAASFPTVARTVHLVVGDRAVAEEITQDAFIQLLMHWKKVSRYERPDLWVRRVAIRKAQRERHRTWRRGQLEKTLEPPVPADVEHDEDAAVRAAVAGLPPKQRAVVVLFYFEDLPMTEIADLVGCSVSTGWSQLHTARRRLAALLSEEVSDDVR